MDHYALSLPIHYIDPPTDRDLPGPGPYVPLRVSRDGVDWIEVALPLRMLPNFYWAAFGIAKSESHSWEVDLAPLVREIHALGYTFHGAVGPEREGLYLMAWRLHDGRGVLYVNTVDEMNRAVDIKRRLTD